MDYVEHTRDNTEYLDYIQTEQWKEIASKRLKIDNYACQGCGSKGSSTNPLQIHHLTYKHKYHEGENQNYYTDLVTLCHSCHNNLHNIMNRITNDKGRRGWSDNKDIPKLSTIIVGSNVYIK